MRDSTTRSRPSTGETWLSCPPYVMTAHIVDVCERSSPQRISYELIDENGSALHGPVNAVLDEGWWRVFQPLLPRYG